jgi:preprotein translocase subunit SecE
MVSPQTGPRAVLSVDGLDDSGGVRFPAHGLLGASGGSGQGGEDGLARRADQDVADLTRENQARDRGSAVTGTIGNDTMANASPFKFMQEVRQEVAKVTWPSRRETTITTIMVFAFATAAGLFFLLADQVIRMTVTFLLGIGN